MPLDDLFDELEDLAEDIGELFEDLISILVGKKSRKRLEKSMKRFGETIAVASIGAAAYKKWDDDDDDDEKKKKSKHRKQKLKPKQPTPKKQPKEIKLEDAAEIITVTESLQVNMVLAMIAAAGADGKIDIEELETLSNAINDAQIDDKDKAMLTQILNQPPTLEEVARAAISPLDACEYYGAALTVIEADTPAESLFLRRFAKSLELDDDLVQTIHETLETN